MNKLQKIVVALLIISVILSVVSVAIDFYVLKSTSERVPSLSVTPTSSDVSGKLDFFVEGTNGR